MSWTLAGYRVEALLGSGAFGEVWSALHLASGEPVALKRLAVGSQADRDKAVAEAATLSALDHPNLVAFRDIRVTPEAVVLVLELAAGGSLADLLARRDRLTPAEVSASLSQIASALAHAHEQGIAHGDVSSANILFTEAGRPKLADLGLARLLAAGGRASAFGTPAYLDPVVAAGGVSGPASDVFALAAVAVHALTGRGLWHDAGPDVAAVLARAATGQMPRLAELEQHCPRDMARAMRRALDPDPARRGTAAEFALDLRAAIPPKPVALTAGRVGAARHRAPDSLPDTGVRAGEHLSVGGRLQRVPTDLTHIARPGIRQALAESEAPARRNLRGRVRWPGTHTHPGRIGGILVGVLVTSIAAAAATAVWPQHRVQAQTATVSPAPVRPDPGVGDSTASGDVIAVLMLLDERRSTAFSKRDVRVLRSVYASSALAQQDIAQLVQRVPAGCSLSGLRTTYDDVRINHRTADRVDLAATAKGAESVLHCAGRAGDQRVAGTGAARLRITLLRVSRDAFGISSIAQVD